MIWRRGGLQLWGFLELQPRPAVVVPTMERAMRKSTARLKTQLAALGEEDLGKRDAWMFAPLLMVAAALPIAIVAIVSVSLYTHSGDRYGGTSFASRFENVYTR
jgi:hypothetical protein